MYAFLIWIGCMTSEIDISFHIIPVFNINGPTVVKSALMLSSLPRLHCLISKSISSLASNAFLESSSFFSCSFLNSWTLSDLFTSIMIPGVCLCVLLKLIAGFKAIWHLLMELFIMSML
eukprot:NODE_24_length_41419_cov_0.818780.p32 type:complete len:119 gc:universal NODE_24_length_41419_cov_0.818780:32609-32965(+)